MHERRGQELTCADITDYDEEVVATLRSYVMNKCQNISTSEALKRADVKKLKITEDQLNAASGSQLVSQPATKPVLNNPLIEKPRIKLSSVASLVAEYNSNWNAAEKCFDDIPVNIERVEKVLNKSISRYRNQIKKLGIDLDDKDFEEAHYGFIMKKDLEPASRIFVRADLHADLKSLLENLNEIQKAGLLDEKFKCQPGVELVFLGDYTDRGQHDLQVLELLACLRLENPDQVHLLKGNISNVPKYSKDEDCIKYLYKSLPYLLKSDTHIIDSYLNHDHLEQRIYQLEDKDIKTALKVPNTHKRRKT